MIVEWDDQKAAANAKKHGVTFQEAATVLEHSLSITFRDPDRSIEEFRFLTIGVGRPRPAGEQPDAADKRAIADDRTRLHLIRGVRGG